MSILEIKDVTYGYTKLEHILFEVNQNFECGKFYAIIGKSGAGKSTLLSLLAGLDEPDSGEILFEGEDISKRDIQIIVRIIFVWYFKTTI